MWKGETIDYRFGNLGFPDSSIGKEICLQCRRPRFNSWIGKIRWRRDRLPTPVFLGLPCGSSGKESAFNVGDLDSILVLGISPGEGKDYPLQYSGLENSMDCMYSIVHGVSKDWTQLSHSPHSPLWLGWSEIKSLFMLSSISFQWPGNDWVLNKICCYKPQGHDPQLLNL